MRYSQWFVESIERSEPVVCEPFEPLPRPLGVVHLRSLPVVDQPVKAGRRELRIRSQQRLQFLRLASIPRPQLVDWVVLSPVGVDAIAAEV